MNLRFFLGAYWPARRESIDECADRLHRFFAGLADCDPRLAVWYGLGRSEKQALAKRVETGDRARLLKLLDSGRNRRDVGRSVIEELGFHIGLWNGHSDPGSVGLGVTCGLYWVSPTATASLCNCVTLDLPEDLGRLAQAAEMAGVLRVVAEAWDPEWAGVMSRGAMQARNFNARRPFVDWMLYLSARLGGELPPFAAPASVQKVGEGGSIVIAQAEPPDPASSRDVGYIERVRRVLRL